VSSETFTRLLNRERFIILQPQCVMRAFQICIYLPPLYDDPWLILKGKLSYLVFQRLTRMIVIRRRKVNLLFFFHVNSHTN